MAARALADRVDPTSVPTSLKSYHALPIGLREVRGVADVSGVLPEVEHRIDVVDYVGLSPSRLARSRAVPIRVLTASGDRIHDGGSPGATLGALQPGDAWPTLLYGYMLECRSFPGGSRKPTVRRYRGKALTRGLCNPGSYMMSDPAEFFAAAAGRFPGGTVARGSHDRTILRRRQPDRHAYL